MIVVEVDGKKAEFNDGEWSSEDPQLAQLLNEVLDPEWARPSHPHPEDQVAKSAAHAVGGRIVSVSPAESVPGRVY